MLLLTVSAAGSISSGRVYRRLTLPIPGGVKPLWDCHLEIDDFLKLR